MTQANDLGAIQNQQGAFFRARNNANIQALATQHYGAAEPPVLYANMLWFSAGDGFIKIRNPTNTQWQNIGTIGPPLKWTTSVDLPQENFTTGDIKESYNPSQPTGWLHLSDGTIGNSSSGATLRANPDCWPLFNLLWSITSDDWCQLFVANVSTRSGRGTSSYLQLECTTPHYVAMASRENNRSIRMGLRAIKFRPSNMDRSRSCHPIRGAPSSTLPLYESSLHTGCQITDTHTLLIQALNHRGAPQDRERFQQDHHQP